MNFKDKLKIFSKKFAHSTLCVSKRGFSLIEMLIAVFVFSLAITMLSGSFFNFMKNYAESKKIQKDVENAQYAMNIMAKTLRTSEMASSVAINSFPFDVYDYSQGKCMRYDLNNSKIQYRSTSPATSGDPTTCVYSSGTFYNLTSDDIVGASISAIPTADFTYGKVTIVLNVQGGTMAAIPIQMSVSLRQ